MYTPGLHDRVPSCVCVCVCLGWRDVKPTERRRSVPEWNNKFRSRRQLSGTSAGPRFIIARIYGNRINVKSRSVACEPEVCAESDGSFWLYMYLYTHTLRFLVNITRVPNKLCIGQYAVQLRANQRPVWTHSTRSVDLFFLGYVQSQLSEPNSPLCIVNMAAVSETSHRSLSPVPDADEPVANWTLRTYAECAASITPGQFAIKKLHNGLWCIENTLKFVMPTTAPPDTRTAKKQQPIRPLPWLLFLPMLISFTASICVVNRLAVLVRGKPLLDGRIISKMQDYRRDLRAIRLVGQRIMRLHGKRTRLGLFSRLARYLSEWFIRPRQLPTAASTLSVSAALL